MLKGFKDFLMRGNVVDLAVAVVIGAAFGLVVKGFLGGLVNPLIAAVAGQPNLDAVGTFTLNHAKFSIGLVLTPQGQDRTMRSHVRSMAPRTSRPLCRKGCKTSERKCIERPAASPSTPRRPA